MKKIQLPIILLYALLVGIPFFAVYAEEDILVVDPPVQKESILVRNADTIIWQGDFDLPASGAIDIPDQTGMTHTIDAHSVLGILYALDQTTDAFTISDLEYYSSFGAFYLKCITPKDSTPLCDNWQYAVNDVTPGTGMDVTTVSGGESLGFYFGSPHQVIFDATTVVAGSPLTATAQTYHYEDNTWLPLLGVTIGVTVPNPNDPWNPTVVTEVAVDGDGKAVITLSDPNTYSIGIKEDYYFPSYTITVTPVQTGGGGGGSPTLITLNIRTAIDFLTSMKSADDSFGASLYTDWVAIAAASTNDGASLKNSLSAYLLTHPLNSTTLTDNERHAMALMAVGINPYSGTDVNYIAKITSTFDGIQFGDSSLVNDDIFALIVLRNAGYTSADDLIKKDISYVISRQSSDGSWGGIDMTAAALQALRNFTDLSDVTLSITQGEQYLTTAQESDGGFGNSFATSWALQALGSNGLLTTQIARADNYLGLLQQTDGGVGPTTDTRENRIWATAYAIAGATHKQWNTILSTYSKQSIENSSPPVQALPPPVIITPPPIKKVDSVTTDTIVKKIVKKHKKNKHKTIVHSIPKEITTFLSASAASAGEQKDPSPSMLHTIVTSLTSPLTWLFVHLGF